MQESLAQPAFRLLVLGLPSSASLLLLAPCQWGKGQCRCGSPPAVRLSVRLGTHHFCSLEGVFWIVSKTSQAWIRPVTEA
jgi:hypothetical protein